MDFTEEQLLHAYDAAPKAIQDALSEGTAVDFMANLSSQYQLHIDVTGKVIEAIRNMLLGLLPPSEFIPTLIRLGVSEATSRQLTADLNSKVFVPLRDEVRKEAPVSATPAVSAVPLSGVGRMELKPVPPPIPPTPSVPAAPQEPPPFNLIRPAASNTIPAAPIAASPVAPVPAPRIEAIPAQPVVRTMASDMELIKSGKDPAAIAPALINHTFQPEQATPSRSFQTASIPVQVPPPAPRPIPVQPDMVHTPPPPTAPAVPQNLSFAPSIGQQTASEHSSDPYREPIT